MSGIKECALWLYLVNATLLATHEIDSALWREWEWFRIIDQEPTNEVSVLDSPRENSGVRGFFARPLKWLVGDQYQFHHFTYDSIESFGRQ
jgi:hypothetical protein